MQILGLHLCKVQKQAKLMRNVQISTTLKEGAKMIGREITEAECPQINTNTRLTSIIHMKNMFMTTCSLYIQRLLNYLINQTTKHLELPISCYMLEHQHTFGNKAVPVITQGSGRSSALRHFVLSLSF